jgi:hypothetical protein
MMISRINLAQNTPFLTCCVVCGSERGGEIRWQRTQADE